MRVLPGGSLIGAVLVSLMLTSPVAAQMPMPRMPLPGQMPGNMPEEVAVASPAEGQTEILDTARPRDPFWPVGYVPKKRVPQVKGITGGSQGKAVAATETAHESVRTPMWDEARKKLDIKGISLIHDKNSAIPKYLAMIAGKLVESGDVVTVKHDERVYRWRVVGISPEGVSLQKLDIRGE